MPDHGTREAANPEGFHCPSKLTHFPMGGVRQQPCLALLRTTYVLYRHEDTLPRRCVLVPATGCIVISSPELSETGGQR